MLPDINLKNNQNKSIDYSGIDSQRKGSLNQSEIGKGRSTQLKETDTSYHDLQPRKLIDWTPLIE